MTGTDETLARELVDALVLGTRLEISYEEAREAVDEAFAVLARPPEAVGEAVERASPLEVLGTIADVYENDDGSDAFDRALMAAYHAGHCAALASMPDRAG